MKRKKWVVAECDKDSAAQIAEQYGINPLAALIAVSRGLDLGDDAESFFDEFSYPETDPFSLIDMDKAVERINRALDNYESITVFGDYDADGITATALLYSYLETNGANVTRYIPDRLVEGYGLNVEAVEALAASGTKLLITVDNGVSAILETQRANELGMDVIITDHHKVGEEIPDAVAVVNPHRPDCPTQFEDFSGVGVALMLVCALEGGGFEGVLEEYGDLAAIGTIGDVVTLKGDNRLIVRTGLRMINEEPRPGITALLNKAGLSGKYISSANVAFALCPRINATGRMGTANKALDLLLCDDEDIADQIAEEIQSLNVLRQKTENDIFVQALEQLARHPERMHDRILVVDSEDWHQGVIGIVAAKLVEKFSKPAIVISHGEKEAKGSCRSVEGFSIFDAINAVSDCLTHFGGHTLAAGIGLECERTDEFRKRINDYARHIEIPFPVQNIDCKLNPRGINLDLLDALQLLEPFGSGNPQPSFGLYGMRIDDLSPISEGKHMRLSLSRNGAKVNAVYFKMPENSFPFVRGDIVDLAVNLDRNVYNGETRVSVIVRNMRFASTDEEAVLSGMRLYDSLCRDDKLTPEQARQLYPSRDFQIAVYKYIKAHPLYEEDYEMLCVRLGDNGAAVSRAMVAVNSMLEAGVLKLNDDGSICDARSQQKANLDETPLMKKLHRYI